MNVKRFDPPRRQLLPPTEVTPAISPVRGRYEPDLSGHPIAYRHRCVEHGHHQG